ncbi:R8 protein [Cladophialophora chaetospira]|uniref:R8 protein n=1 Tax=Cladophialophora chaetospira TaxID=386627 RepID=A0AA39CKV7_9EURO|nr:R8 protein [Cladophialophora chaetospira]
MFYSHEILTNRQYGVATIWLVATLGAKSNLKKITRRAIIDVDLQKACKTITEPEVPLALRLQGSLLFGVSRVFQQQCGYVLTDVTSLRDNMRIRASLIQDIELDPDVGKTRPEQLNLALDPYFLPDIDINFDLSAFGFPSDRSSSSRDGSSLRSLPSSQTSLRADEEGGDLGLDIDIPSVSGPSVGNDGFDLPLGAGTSSAAKAGSRVNRLPSLFGEEPAIIDEPLFDVDDNGYLRPAMSMDQFAELEMPSIEGQPPRSDAVLGGPTDTELLPAAREDEPMLNFNDDMVFFGDDEPPLAPAAPLIPLTPEPNDGEEQQARKPSASVQPSEESSETAEAPQRRARASKAIQKDRETELTNRALNEWNQNYLANMATALLYKEKNVKAAEAKRNADFWVLQQGLGNVASTFGIDREPHPLAIFSGQSLWDLLRGPSRGTKRSHAASPADEQEEEERRVRARTTSGEGVARGNDGEVLHFDEDGLMFNGDDFEIEPEVGRHAPPSLPDHSSGMPWNLSAGGSRQSSVRPAGSGLIPRLSSSVGDLPGGVELGSLPSLSRRGSRLTSASPLFGKGMPSLSRHSSHGLQDPSHLTSNDDQFADLDAQLGAGLDPDFELYGPSATVDTQTAAQSQWVAATLENEAYNFLTFVNTKIQGKGGQEQEVLTDEEIPETQEQNITFDELLPPTHNSAIVGAQALLHVLALTTKGLLQVYQAEHFGDIQISVVSH